jgi:hypothetical protein
MVSVHQATGLICPEGSTVGIHATHNNSLSVNIQSPVMAQSADMTVTSVIIDKNVSVYQSSSVSFPHPMSQRL